MIDYQNSTIQQLIVHHVGNKANYEDLNLSKELLKLEPPRLEELLLQYFLKPYNQPEYYHFSFSNGNHKMNPIYNYVNGIFSDESTLLINSVNIAQHLFESSEHPNIKAGDLFVVHFTSVFIGDESVEAIGIFKSENKHAFLQLRNLQTSFSLSFDDGISIDKLDKGCLVFNTDEEKGYKVCIIDKTGRGEEAHFWKDTFLRLKPASDEYHHTSDFMHITKHFVTEQLPQEFEVNKTDAIDLLNRTSDYFKKNENFNKEDFEDQVFQQPEIIDSFRKFDEHYREEMELGSADNFAISSQAVKKQARIFKSVLKLDKNFHIYIHGNRNLIEQGVENDGRKFYKIYYDNEQ